MGTRRAALSVVLWATVVSGGVGAGAGGGGGGGGGVESAAVEVAVAEVAVLADGGGAGGVGGGASHERWMGSLSWRNIGPARGGRAQAVAGVNGDGQTFYMGATGGGVWKTVDGGASWRNISDGFFKTGSVGDIAVADSDPNVIYVGMGEADIRGNFSHGDGVYKSTDAGKTWAHVGLKDTRQIGRVAVHPQDADVVYVAALGHVFGPNAERGVFRTKDGGATWQRVLYVDDKTGAIDVAIDPFNPRVVYAGMWQVYRTPWGLESGGEGSGLYRSTDGGETWTELTEGLPGGIKGKIGVSPSAARRDLVYAIVEAEEGGVFVSGNGGDSWRRVNEDRALRQRAWYYSHIVADPGDENVVYVLNVGFHRSVDGGRTFSTIRVPHGDNHDLWIDPTDSRRMVNSNDGGANVTFNGGASWTEQTGQPTAQFYRVTTDTNHPYRVYGAQQDNSTVSVSSRGTAFGAWERDLYAVGGCECGYIAVHPEEPDIVYAGCYGGQLEIYDHGLGEARDVSVWPENPMGSGADVLRERFQWTFPIVISPHDPETVYTASQRVFRTTNRGQSWEAISPDLTTNDKTKQGPSGGPITKDNTAVEYYCTVFTVAESPVEPGLIWAGSDDGLIHVTGDGGGTWEDVTPRGMGDWPMVSLIEASPHDADTAYAAVTRYKMNDYRPYVYRTRDRGRSWELVAGGIGEMDFVRSVREDPQVEGLLYAGTETGVYVSFNAGESWEPLRLNLPAVPVTDVAVRGDDLVIATQGRSFWILDDLTVLREAAANGMRPFEPRLIGPAAAYREGWDAVRTHFYLPESAAQAGSASLTFAFEDGGVVRRFELAFEEEGEGDGAGGSRRGGGERVTVKAGMNLFTWNMRSEGPVLVPGAVAWPSPPPGPRVPPGRYTVTLEVDGWSASEPLEILPDPRYRTTPEGYAAQHALLVDIRDALSEAHRAVNDIREVRRQVDAVVSRAQAAGMGDSIAASAASLRRRLGEVEEAIIQTRSRSSQDPLNFPIKLNDKIGALAYAVDGDHAPADQHYAVFNDLRGKLDERLADLRELMDEDVPAFNRLVNQQRIPAIAVEGREADKVGPRGEATSGRGG